MNLDRVWIITRKDLAEIRKNKLILYTMIVIPIAFAVIFPASTVLRLPDVEAKNFEVLIYLITTGFIPLFSVLPAAIPSVISSYSFVGEKTEKTLEPLLATPITDNELLLGKIMASFIPGVLITIVAFLLFTIVVDVLSYEQLGYLLLPNTIWLVAIFVLSPLVALATITITIILSSRMNDPRAIQQVSVLIILPFLFLFFGGVSQLFVLDLNIMFIMIVLFAIVDRFLFAFARKLFERESILTKWK